MPGLEIFFQGIKKFRIDGRQQMSLARLLQRKPVDTEHAVIGIQVRILTTPDGRIRLRLHMRQTANQGMAQTTAVPKDGFL